MNKKNFYSLDPFMPIKVNNIGTIKKAEGTELNNIQNDFEYSNLLINEKKMRIRTPQVKKGYVLFATKDFIGEPNEIGKNLFEDFIMSASSLMDLPEFIIFANSGVRITTNEKIITYLRKIKKYGTKIILSLESLEFYGLNDKNTIGIKEVTSDIAEKVILAKKIINL